LHCAHTRARQAALDADKFKDEIVPLHVMLEELDERGKKQRREVVFDKDEGVRRDSSAEGLAKLKPAFHVKGTITAGNASQMSDGRSGGDRDV
jgi:acetyl-CoA acyltransferase